LWGIFIDNCVYSVSNRCFIVVFYVQFGTNHCFLVILWTGLFPGYVKHLWILKWYTNLIVDLRAYTKSLFMQVQYKMKDHVYWSYGKSLRKFSTKWEFYWEGCVPLPTMLTISPLQLSFCTLYNCIVCIVAKICFLVKRKLKYCHSCMHLYKMRENIPKLAYFVIKTE
jgi:hypothetical protein